MKKLHEWLKGGRGHKGEYIYYINRSKAKRFNDYVEYNPTTKLCYLQLRVPSSISGEDYNPKWKVPLKHKLRKHLNIPYTSKVFFGVERICKYSGLAKYAITFQLYCMLDNRPTPEQIDGLVSLITQSVREQEEWLTSTSK